jgi:NAD(P)-dependent dehydrogenase (short-subunit alcohol dehydrogenase family)
MALRRDRVAVATGAGRGIGRAEARFPAREGASVLVNDPGVERDGRGADVGVARAVADEIEAARGQAVADARSEYVDARAAAAGPFGAPIAPPTFPMRFLCDALDPDFFFDPGLNPAGIVPAQQAFV